MDSKLQDILDFGSSHPVGCLAGVVLCVAALVFVWLVELRHVGRTHQRWDHEDRLQLPPDDGRPVQPRIHRAE
jgi:hypothetical protein